MALSQRQASRFYAAFYRWSHYAQRPPPCSPAYKHSGAKLGHSLPVRNYHPAPRLRQHGQPESQAQIDDSNPIAPSPEDEANRRLEEKEEDQSAVSVQKPPPEQQTPSAKGEGTPGSLDLGVDTKQLQDEVRAIMRKVPGSVAIITARSIDPDTQKHVPLGVAVSSLSTVTLDPPTISFNLKHPSKTLDAIRAANGLFRVHFLAADRGGATMVEIFSRGNHREAYTQRLKHAKIVVPKPGPDASTSKSYAPRIHGDATRSALECKLIHELEVADHVILVAQINSLDSKVLRNPGLVYVEGSFRRVDGTKLMSHSKSYAPPADIAWSAWNYPLFPGEGERLDYVDRLRNAIMTRPEYADLPDREVCRKITDSFPVPPKMFGINLDVLVAECRRKPGQAHNPNAMRASLPVLADFYGPLTSSQVWKVLDRAKALVEQKPSCIGVGYARFLRLLGLGMISTNVLPSDILSHLRANGLIEASHHAPVDHKSMSDRDITYFERIEEKLRQHLRSSKYSDAISAKFEDLLTAVGVTDDTQFVARVLRSNRWRLQVEEAPELFDASKMDIAGEVSKEETRVILRRLVNFMHLDSKKLFLQWMDIPWIESLRRVGVHPLITGIDIGFFFGKTTYLYHNTPQFCDLTGKVDQMLEPWFDKTVTWEDFQDRVNHLVQTSPLRAMSWSNEDKFAALGIHKDTKIQVPSSDQGGSPSQDNMLDMVVAKELKNHYGNGIEEENQAIATYLKEHYNYDVTRNETKGSF